MVSRMQSVGVGSMHWYAFSLLLCLLLVLPTSWAETNRIPGTGLLRVKYAGYDLAVINNEKEMQTLLSETPWVMVSASLSNTKAIFDRQDASVCLVVVDSSRKVGNRDLLRASVDAARLHYSRPQGRTNLIVFAVLDLSEHSALRKQYTFREYPALMFFPVRKYKEGEWHPLDYDGPDNHKELLAFMEKHIVTARKDSRIRDIDELLWQRPSGSYLLNDSGSVQKSAHGSWRDEYVPLVEEVSSLVAKVLYICTEGPLCNRLQTASVSLARWYDHIRGLSNCFQLFEHPFIKELETIGIVDDNVPSIFDRYLAVLGTPTEEVIASELGQCGEKETSRIADISLNLIPSAHLQRLSANMKKLLASPAKDSFGCSFASPCEWKLVPVTYQFRKHILSRLVRQMTRFDSIHRTVLDPLQRLCFREARDYFGDIIGSASEYMTNSSTLLDSMFLTVQDVTAQYEVSHMRGMSELTEPGRWRFTPAAQPLFEWMIKEVDKAVKTFASSLAELDKGSRPATPWPIRRDAYPINYHAQHSWAVVSQSGWASLNASLSANTAELSRVSELSKVGREDVIAIEALLGNVFCPLQRVCMGYILSHQCGSDPHALPLVDSYCKLVSSLLNVPETLQSAVDIMTSALNVLDTAYDGHGAAETGPENIADGTLSAAELQASHPLFTSDRYQSLAPQQRTQLATRLSKYEQFKEWLMSSCFL